MPARQVPDFSNGNSESYGQAGGNPDCAAEANSFLMQPQIYKILQFSQMAINKGIMQSYTLRER
jgi:hypothetical protein